MSIVSIMLDAKSNLSKLIDGIERGLDREIMIARNGRPQPALSPPLSRFPASASDTILLV